VAAIMLLFAAMNANRSLATTRIAPISWKAKGKSWSSFANRHGDWGRDAALWLGRRVGRQSLAELGNLAGGLDYAVVSKVIARLSRPLTSNAVLGD
jgi:hypothetical protein